MKMEKRDPQEISTLDRIVYEIDPFVDDFAVASGIDIYSFEDYLEYDRFLLFNALLITNHPKIMEAVKKIRKELNLTKLRKYKKEDAEDGTYDNLLLERLKKPFLSSLNKQLDCFFSGAGKNLPQYDWRDEIAIWILTDILPLPLDLFLSFDLLRKIPDVLPSQLKNCPVLVIKKRMRERELNQLITFIKENERGIINYTTHLPDPPVKRADIDLARLAAGLWEIRKDSFKNYKDKEKVEESYQNYLENKELLYDTENLRKLEADARGYLNKLYPL